MHHRRASPQAFQGSDLPIPNPDLRTLRLSYSSLSTILLIPTSCILQSTIFFPPNEKKLITINLTRRSKKEPAKHLKTTFRITSMPADVFPRTTVVQMPGEPLLKTMGEILLNGKAFGRVPMEIFTSWKPNTTWIL